MTRKQFLSMAASYGRVFIAALVAAVVLAWNVLPADQRDLSTWDGTDVKVFASAVLGALVTTLINALRSGETRFGVGAQGDESPAEG